MVTLLHAVAIGINDYADKRYARQAHLNFAQADAEEMEKVLRTSPALQLEQIHVLTNRDATRKRVMESLQSVFTDRFPGQNTIALFYFSGHGLHNRRDDRIWLCCSDTDFSDPHDEGGIRLNDIYEMLMRSSAECAIAIIDACYSGGIIDTSYIYHISPAEHAKKAIEALRGPDGKTIAIFAACRENQVAREDNTNKHGRYTQALLRGWRDGEAREVDGTVNLLGLANYITRSFADDRQVPRVSILGGKPVILWQGTPRPASPQEPLPQYPEPSEGIRITNDVGLPKKEDKKSRFKIL